MGKGAGQEALPWGLPRGLTWAMAHLTMGPQASEARLTIS